MADNLLLAVVTEGKRDRKHLITAAQAFGIRHIGFSTMRRVAESSSRSLDGGEPRRGDCRVLKAAGVRAIKFHGLRHTSATLLLAAGEPVHVVAARVGHAKVTTTLETYAHALPSHGKAAASRLGAILHGAG